MLNYFYKNRLNRKQKNRIKSSYYKINRFITDTFFSYDIKQLKTALQQLGIKEKDTVFLHSSFNYFNGFKGEAKGIINCLIDILGDEGNLLMVSMPYSSSSYDYLKKKPIFDVRKTPSRMGIISEMFRRKKGVLRSLHPTHPVLAYGKDAAELVKDHEKCKYPCGEKTPFDKFRNLNGRIFHFDVPFSKGFTFIHYLEDMIKDSLPFSLYTEDPISARVSDYHGKEFEIETYVFSDKAVRTRNLDILGRYLLKQKKIKNLKIGKTRLMLVSAEDAISGTRKMLENNMYFFTL